MPEITYKITEECGVISENSRGWTKELNLVSWNDRPAKFDIREWAPDHSRMAKGLTFTAEELVKTSIFLPKIFRTDKKSKDRL